MIFPLKFIVVIIATSALAIPRIGAEADEERDITRDAISQHTHSLYSPYTHNEFENEYWDFGGNAIVRVYNEVRLTSDMPSQEGWLWTRHPLVSDAWSINFVFQIHGDNPALHGDGFAFWFVDSPFRPGPVFGYKDQFTGLGVFFDTYSNGNKDHSFPYISAMIGDGVKTYDHNNDNKASITGHGCEANIRDHTSTLQARVTYFKNSVLELEFKDGGSKGWQTCFVLEGVNVTLPDAGFIGFSAATGDAHDIHDIKKVETFTHMVDSVHAKEEYYGRDSIVGHGESEPWSHFMSIVIWLLQAGVVAVLCMVAFYGYRTYSAKSMKKF